MTCTRLLHRWLRAACLATGLGGGAAQAYDLPNINLGFTSFLDGGVPSGPGWYTEQYFQVYSADSLKDNNGRRIGLPRQDVGVFVGISQLAYMAPLTLGPGSPGINLMLPFIPHASADDGLGGSVLKTNTGVGDVLVGPFYQFNPIMGPNGPLFVARVELSMLLPTGSYDRGAAVNPGSNFFSFNPYVAGTLFLTPDWTVTTRINYLWNDRNGHPSAAFGPAVLSTQAGEAIHVNFATEYAVSKELRVGLNGYWLQQLTDTKVNGVAAPGRRERVAGIGPGLLWSITKDAFLMVNAYTEFGARNRPEGQRYVVRWVGHFD